MSVPFSLSEVVCYFFPDEFYERASEASLRLAANKSPCGCFFHLRARRFLKKKKNNKKKIVIIENKGSTDRLWSISSRSLLTGKTYAYLSDVCCSLTKLRKWVQSLWAIFRFLFGNWWNTCLLKMNLRALGCLNLKLESLIYNRRQNCWDIVLK